MLLNPNVTSLNQKTEGMWDGERSFIGPTGRSQIYQILSNYTISYSQEPSRNQISYIKSNTATIKGIFFSLFLLSSGSLLILPEGVVVGIQIFACGPELPIE